MIPEQYGQVRWGRRFVGWGTVLAILFCLHNTALADGPTASLSLHTLVEDETICVSAGALGHGQGLSIASVEGISEAGDERLSSYLSIHPLQTEFPPKATDGSATVITLDGSKSRDPLGQNVTREWMQVFLEDEPALAITVQKGTAGLSAEVKAPEVTCRTTFTIRLAVGDGTWTTFDEVSFDVVPETEGSDCSDSKHRVPANVPYPHMYEACLAAHEVSANAHDLGSKSLREVRLLMFQLVSTRAVLVERCGEMALEGKSAPAAERLIIEADEQLLALAEELQRRDPSLANAAVLLIPDDEGIHVLGLETIEQTVHFAKPKDMVYVFGGVDVFPEALNPGVIVVESVSQGIPTPAHGEVALVPVDHRFFPVCLVRGVTSASAGEKVTLSAADSYDINGEALTYEWFQTDGVKVAAIDQCKTEECTFTTPETRNGTRIPIRVRVKNQKSQIWSEPTYFTVSVAGTLVGKTRIIEANQFTTGLDGWLNEVNRKPSETERVEGKNALDYPAEWDKEKGIVKIPWESENEYQGIYKDFDLTGQWYPDTPLGVRIRARAESTYQGTKERWANHPKTVIIEIRDLSTVKTEEFRDGEYHGLERLTPAERIYQHRLVLTSSDWPDQTMHRIEIGELLRSRGITKFQVALIRQSYTNNLWFQSLEIDEFRLETQDESDWDPPPIAQGRVTDAALDGEADSKSALSVEAISGKVYGYGAGGKDGICFTPPANYSGSDFAHVTLSDRSGKQATTVASFEVRNGEGDDDPPVAFCAGSARAIVAYPGDNVELNGLASYDPEGAALSYEWRASAGALIRGVDDDDSQGSKTVGAARAVYTAPEQPGAHTFTLEVWETGKKDGPHSTCTTQVMVKAFPDEADHHVCPADPENAFFDLADALAEAKNGDVIRFCAGTHIIGGGNKFWTITKAVTLICEDRETTILRGADPKLPVLTVQSSNVRVLGCTIEHDFDGIHVKPIAATKKKSVGRYHWELGGWTDNVHFKNNRLAVDGVGFKFYGEQAARILSTSNGASNVHIAKNIIEARLGCVESNKGVTGALTITENDCLGYEDIGLDITYRNKSSNLDPRTDKTKLTVKDNLFLGIGDPIQTRILTRTGRKYRRAVHYRKNSYATRQREAMPYVTVEPIDITRKTDMASCGPADDPSDCAPLSVHATRADDTLPFSRQALALSGDTDAIATILSLPLDGWIWCGDQKIDWFPVNLWTELGVTAQDCFYAPDPGFLYGDDPFAIGIVIGDSEMNDVDVPVHVDRLETPAPKVKQAFAADGEFHPTIEVALFIRDPDGDTDLKAELDFGPRYGTVTIVHEILTYTAFGSTLDDDCLQLTIRDSGDASYTRGICFNKDGAKIVDPIAIPDPRKDADADTEDSGVAGLAQKSAEKEDVPKISRGHYVNDGKVRVGTTIFQIDGEGNIASEKQPIDFVVSKDAYPEPGIVTLAHALESGQGKTIYVEAGIYDATGLIVPAGMSMFCHDDAVITGTVTLYKAIGARFYNCKIEGDVDFGGYGYKTYYETGTRSHYTRYKGNYKRGTYNYFKQPYPETYNVHFEASEVTGSFLLTPPEQGTHQYNWKWKDKNTPKPNMPRGPDTNPAPAIVLAKTTVGGTIPEAMNVSVVDTLDGIGPVLTAEETDWVVSMSAYLAPGVTTLAAAVKAAGVNNNYIFLSAGTYNGLESVDYRGVTTPISVGNVVIECAPGVVITGGINLSGTTLRGCPVTGTVSILGSAVIEDSHIQGDVDLGGATYRKYAEKSKVWTQQVPRTTNVTVTDSLIEGHVKQQIVNINDYTGGTNYVRRTHENLPKGRVKHPGTLRFVDSMVTQTVRVSLEVIWDGDSRGEAADVVAGDGIVVPPLRVEVIEDTPVEFVLDAKHFAPGRLRYIITSLPAHGRAEIWPRDATEGDGTEGVALAVGDEVYPSNPNNKFVYTPDANFPGGADDLATDILGFSLHHGDVDGEGAAAQVEFSVQGVDDGPVFVDEEASVAADSEHYIEIPKDSVSDPEGDGPFTLTSATVLGVDGGEAGSVHIGEGLRMIYRAPKHNFEGAVIRYHAKDINGTVSSEPGIVIVKRIEKEEIVVHTTVKAGSRAALALPAPKPVTSAKAATEGITREIHDIVKPDIVVAADGSGLYKDLCQALDSIGSEHHQRLITTGMTVLVLPGSYVLDPGCTLYPGVNLIGRDNPILYGQLNTFDLLPADIRGFTFAAGLPPEERLQVERLDELGFVTRTAEEIQAGFPASGNWFVGPGTYSGGTDDAGNPKPIVVRGGRIFCSPDAIFEGPISIQGNPTFEGCHFRSTIDLGKFSSYYVIGKNKGRKIYTRHSQAISKRVIFINSVIDGSITQPPRPAPRTLDRKASSALASHDYPGVHRRHPVGTLTLTNTTVTQTVGVALSVIDSTKAITGQGVRIKRFQWKQVGYAKRGGGRAGRTKYYRVLEQFAGNLWILDNAFCGASEEFETQLVASDKVEEHEFYELIKYVVEAGDPRGYRIEKLGCPLHEEAERAALAKFLENADDGEEDTSSAADQSVAKSARKVASGGEMVYLASEPRYCQVEDKDGNSIAQGGGSDTIHIKADNRPNVSDKMTFVRANGDTFESVTFIVQILPKDMQLPELEFETPINTPLKVKLVPKGMDYTLVLPGSKTAKNGRVKKISDNEVEYRPKTGYYDGKPSVSLNRFVDGVSGAWSIAPNGSSQPTGKLTKQGGFLEFSGHSDSKINTGVLRHYVDISDWTGEGALLLYMDTQVPGTGSAALTIYNRDGERLNQNPIPVNKSSMTVDLSQFVAPGEQGITFEFMLIRKGAGHCRSAAWQSQCQAVREAEKATQGHVLQIFEFRLTGYHTAKDDASGDSFAYGWKDADGSTAFGTVRVRVAGKSERMLIADNFEQGVDGWSLLEQQIAGTQPTAFNVDYQLRRYVDSKNGGTQARIEGEGQNAYAGMQTGEISLKQCAGKRPLSVYARYRAEYRHPTKQERHKAGTQDTVMLWMWDAAQSLDSAPLYTQELIGSKMPTPGHNETGWQIHEEDLSHHLDADAQAIRLAFVLVNDGSKGPRSLWVDEVTLRCGGQETSSGFSGVEQVYLADHFDNESDAGTSAGWAFDYDVTTAGYQPKNDPAATQSDGALVVPALGHVNWSITKNISIAGFSPKRALLLDIDFAIAPGSPSRHQQWQIDVINAADSSLLHRNSLAIRQVYNSERDRDQGRFTLDLSKKLPEDTTDVILRIYSPYGDAVSFDSITLEGYQRVDAASGVSSDGPLVFEHFATSLSGWDRYEVRGDAPHSPFSYQMVHDGEHARISGDDHKGVIAGIAKEGIELRPEDRKVLPLTVRHRLIADRHNGNLNAQISYLDAEGVVHRSDLVEIHKHPQIGDAGWRISTVDVDIGSWIPEEIQEIDFALVVVDTQGIKHNHKDHPEPGFAQVTQTAYIDWVQLGFDRNEDEDAAIAAAAQPRVASIDQTMTAKTSQACKVTTHLNGYTDVDLVACGLMDDLGDGVSAQTLTLNEQTEQGALIEDLGGGKIRVHAGFDTDQSDLVGFCLSHPASTGPTLSCESLIVEIKQASDTRPEAADAVAVTQMGQTRWIKLLGSDEDGDALTYQLVVGPEVGHAEIEDDTIRYQPELGHIGKVVMTYRVCDNNDAKEIECSEPATATIYVSERMALASGAPADFAEALRTLFTREMLGDLIPRSPPYNAADAPIVSDHHVKVPEDGETEFVVHRFDPIYGHRGGAIPETGYVVSYGTNGTEVDTDIAGMFASEHLEYVVLVDCKYGKLTAIDNGRRLHYQPPPDFFGEDVCPYWVFNGASISDKPGIAYITVESQNDAPFFTALLSVVHEVADEVATSQFAFSEGEVKTSIGDLAMTIRGALGDQLDYQVRAKEDGDVPGALQAHGDEDWHMANSGEVNLTTLSGDKKTIESVTFNRNPFGGPAQNTMRKDVFALPPESKNADGVELVVDEVTGTPVLGEFLYSVTPHGQVTHELSDDGTRSVYSIKGDDGVTKKVVRAHSIGEDGKSKEGDVLWGTDDAGFAYRYHVANSGLGDSLLIEWKFAKSSIESVKDTGEPVVAKDAQPVEMRSYVLATTEPAEDPTDDPVAKAGLGFDSLVSEIIFAEDPRRLPVAMTYWLGARIFRVTLGPHQPWERLRVQTGTNNLLLTTVINDVPVAYTIPIQNRDPDPEAEVNPVDWTASVARFVRPDRIFADINAVYITPQYGLSKNKRGKKICQTIYLAQRGDGAWYATTLANAEAVDERCWAVTGNVVLERLTLPADYGQERRYIDPDTGKVGDLLGETFIVEHSLHKNTAAWGSVDTDGDGIYDSMYVVQYVPEKVTFFDTLEDPPKSLKQLQLDKLRREIKKKNRKAAEALAKKKQEAFENEGIGSAEYEAYANAKYYYGELNRGGDGTEQEDDYEYSSADQACTYLQDVPAFNHAHPNACRDEDEERRLIVEGYSMFDNKTLKHVVIAFSDTKSNRLYKPANIPAGEITRYKILIHNSQRTGAWDEIRVDYVGKHLSPSAVWRDAATSGLHAICISGPDDDYGFSRSCFVEEKGSLKRKVWSIDNLGWPSTQNNNIASTHKGKTLKDVAVAILQLRNDAPWGSLPTAEAVASALGLPPPATEVTGSSLAGETKEVDTNQCAGMEPRIVDGVAEIGIPVNGPGQRDTFFTDKKVAACLNYLKLQALTNPELALFAGGKKFYYVLDKKFMRRFTIREYFEGPDQDTLDKLIVFGVPPHEVPSVRRQILNSDGLYNKLKDKDGEVPSNKLVFDTEYARELAKELGEEQIQKRVIPIGSETFVVEETWTEDGTLILAELVSVTGPPPQDMGCFPTSLPRPKEVKRTYLMKDDADRVEALLRNMKDSKYKSLGGDSRDWVYAGGGSRKAGDGEFRIKGRLVARSESMSISQMDIPGQASGNARGHYTVNAFGVQVDKIIKMWGKAPSEQGSICKRPRYKGVTLHFDGDIDNFSAAVPANVSIQGCYNRNEVFEPEPVEYAIKNSNNGRLSLTVASRSGSAIVTDPNAIKKDDSAEDKDKEKDEEADKANTSIDFFLNDKGEFPITINMAPGTPAGAEARILVQYQRDGDKKQNKHAMPTYQVIRVTAVAKDDDQCEFPAPVVDDEDDNDGDDGTDSGNDDKYEDTEIAGTDIVIRAPKAGFSFRGQQGGPFIGNPDSGEVKITIENTGTEKVTYQILIDAPFGLGELQEEAQQKPEPIGGELAAGSSQAISLEVWGEAAEELAAGDHTGTMTVRIAEDEGTQATIDLSLAVKTPPAIVGDPVELSVLFVYTEDAGQEALKEDKDKDTGTIDERIQLAIDHTNDVVFPGSGLAVTLKPTIKRLRQYNDKGSVNANYDALINGEIDSQLKDDRSAAQADLVVLVFDGNNADLVGRAIGLESTVTEKDKWIAYSVLDHRALPKKGVLTRTSVLAHEIGHNLGCGHQEDQQEMALFDASALGYLVTGTRFGTIMTTPQGLSSNREFERLPYFSSPTVVATYGTSTAVGKFDCANTIRQTAPIIANINGGHLTRSMVLALGGIESIASPDRGGDVTIGDGHLSECTPVPDVEWTINKATGMLEATGPSFGSLTFPMQDSDQYAGEAFDFSDKPDGCLTGLDSITWSDSFIPAWAARGVSLSEGEVAVFRVTGNNLTGAGCTTEGYALIRTNDNDRIDFTHEDTSGFLLAEPDAELTYHIHVNEHAIPLPSWADVGFLTELIRRNPQHPRTSLIGTSRTTYEDWNGDGQPDYFDNPYMYRFGINEGETSDVYRPSMWAQACSDWPKQGLVANWDFQEKNGNDASGTGNHASFLVEKFAKDEEDPNKRRNALTGVMKTPDTADLQFAPSDNFLVSVWVYPVAMSEEGVIIGNIRKQDGKDVRGWALTYQNDQLSLVLDGAGPAKSFSADLKPDERWHHVAFLWQDQTAQVLIDGAHAVVKPTLELPHFATTNLLLVGGGIHNGAVADNFIGSIDDISILRGKYNARDAEKLAQKGAQPELGLVGHWRFDAPDALGFDSSRRKNHGQVGPNDDGDTLSPGRERKHQQQGEEEKALVGVLRVETDAPSEETESEQASKDAKVAPADLQLGPNDNFLITAWVYPPNPGEMPDAGIVIGNLGTTEKGSGWELLLDEELRPKWRAQKDDQTFSHIYPNAPALHGDLLGWHHVAVLWQNQKVRIFFDGKEPSNVSNRVEVPGFHSTSPVVIGARATTNAGVYAHHFKGALDDVTIRRGSYDENDVEDFYEDERDEAKDNKIDPRTLVRKKSVITDSDLGLAIKLYRDRGEMIVEIVDTKSGDYVFGTVSQVSTYMKNKNLTSSDVRISLVGKLDKVTPTSEVSNPSGIAELAPLNTIWSPAQKLRTDGVQLDDKGQPVDDGKSQFWRIAMLYDESTALLEVTYQGSEDKLYLIRSY